MYEEERRKRKGEFLMDRGEKKKRERMDARGEKEKRNNIFFF